MCEGWLQRIHGWPKWIGYKCHKEEKIEACGQKEE